MHCSARTVQVLPAGLCPGLDLCAELKAEFAKCKEAQTIQMSAVKEKVSKLEQALEQKEAVLAGRIAQHGRVNSSPEQ